MNRLFKYKERVDTRFDLFSLLSEACELEHSLACSYLYTAFSLRKENGEGLTGEQIQLTRKWAAKIFFVAAQEMLHLSQAWNLLSAIGGTAYYFRPNFPQTGKYYPFNVPLALEPFSLESLQRFILYELPSSKDEKAFAKATFGFVSEDDYKYKTVGELYQMIRQGFQDLPEEELFFKDQRDLQMGREEIDFPEIIKVIDRDSACRAIDMITEQGEGTSKDDRQNSHYEAFRGIEDEYRKILRINPAFNPSRNIVSNPVTYYRGNYAAMEGQLIINETTRDISDLFDDIYNLMLRALQFAFNHADNKTIRKTLADAAIQLMIRAIRPLGEVLTTLPAFNDPELKKAGPSFALTRHLPFTQDAETTLQLFKERGSDLAERLKRYAHVDPKIGGVQKSMEDIVGRMS